MTELAIPFFGAQLVVVVIGLVLYHVIRRKPNLAGRRRSLGYITVLQVLAKEGLDELRRGLSEIMGFKDKKSKLEGQSRASRGLGVGWAQRAFMLVFLAGTWFLLYESESAIGVILNLTSGFLSLSREQAAFAGPLAALGAFGVFHMASLAAHKSDRARRTWHWACLGILVSLVSVGVAWVVFLSGRTVDPADLVAATQMEGTLAKTLYALALLNAIAAAFVGTALLLLLEDRFLENEIARVDVLIRDLGDHVLQVARELKEHGIEIPQELEEELKNLTQPTAPRPAGPPVISLVLLAVACNVEAQPAGFVRPAFTVSNVQAQVRGAGTCEWLFDVSISTDSASRQEALQMFGQDLGSFIKAKGCRLFRGSAFSGDPYSRFVEVEIPVVESSTGPCVEETPAQPQAVDAFFPNLLKARQQLMARRCGKQLRDNEMLALARHRQAVIDTARQVQDVVQNTEPKGNCTALELVIALAHARSAAVVVITDGYSSCPHSSDIDAVEDGADFSWLTVLLIPSRGSVDQRWGELAGRMARMRARYPGARVRPYNELTGTFWAR